MCRPFVMPIGKINGAVRANGGVAGSEPVVVACEQFSTVAGFESGAVLLNFTPHPAVPQCVYVDVSVAKRFRKCLALVNNSADRDVTADEIFVRHVVDVTVGVRIVESAMFAELFPVVSALHA